MAEQWKAWSRRNSMWRTYRVGLMLLRTLYIINRERSRVVRARERGDYDVHPNMETLLSILREFRDTAIELGGLMIKLGQFLGARADLLPQEALAVLAGLHDAVPPERFAHIRGVLEREWGAPVSEICALIEPIPAGSASLGQVHEARLHDGRRVAIKVQRPGIHHIVHTDLRTLRWVLRIVAWLAPVANRITNLNALYHEFSRTVAEELDYRQEARNAQQFGEIFVSEPDIIAPAVIEEYSTRHVLVLTWMDGIKITDFPALDAACVDRLWLANRITQAYLKQILEVGFFHADPHPGNILVQPRQDSSRIVFVDFGMMGVITPRMRSGLRDCFVGVAAQDPALVVRGFDALGFIGPSANHEAIERMVGVMLARYNAAPAGWVRNTNPQELMGDMESALYDQPFRLPAQFAFFGRMAAMLLGLTTALSPDYNFIQVATPYAKHFMGGGGLDSILRLLGIESVEALGRDLLRNSMITARSLSSIPRRLDRVLERAERGELHLVIESADLNLRGRRQPNARGVRGWLSRPIPIWLPVGLVGVYGVFRFLARQTTRMRKSGPASRA